LTPAPATRASIKFNFTFPYRGNTQPFSTRVYIDGNLAPTDAEFLALYDNIKMGFVALLSSRTTLQGATGYHPGSDVPVWSGGSPIACACSLASGDVDTPGDAAMLCRWSTTQRTSKNHPIYLFMYLHDAWHTSGNADTLASQQHGAFESLGTFMLDGSWSDGTNDIRKCGPYGAVAQSRFVEPLITHRDFPR
jgi:hypothetical protein